MKVILFLIAAAALEVSGDATIRKWAQDHQSAWFAVLGCAMLAAYGIAVNEVRWDLAKLLGVYVVFFAAAAVFWGKFVRHETVPWTTWVGIIVIAIGGAIIQWGPAATSR